MWTCTMRMMTQVCKAQASLHAHVPQVHGSTPRCARAGRQEWVFTPVTPGSSQYFITRCGATALVACWHTSCQPAGCHAALQEPVSALPCSEDQWTNLHLSNACDQHQAEQHSRLPCACSYNGLTCGQTYLTPSGLCSTNLTTVGFTGAAITTDLLQVCPCAGSDALTAWKSAACAP